MRVPVKVQRTGTDKYGRTLARVTVNGQDAGAYVVGKGLARRWQWGAAPRPYRFFARGCQVVGNSDPVNSLASGSSEWF